jgi:hypothetical protein
MSTTAAETEATENWDNDFEDSHQLPKKIMQRHCEESWDEDDDDDENKTDEFGLSAEEDRTITVKSRRAALARLSLWPSSSLSCFFQHQLQSTPIHPVLSLSSLLPFAGKGKDVA